MPLQCATNNRIKYLVQKAKFRVLLFRVFTAWIRVFLHQENIALFALENKSSTQY